MAKDDNTTIFNCIDNENTAKLISLLEEGVDLNVKKTVGIKKYTPLQYIAMKIDTASEKAFQTARDNYGLTYGEDSDLSKKMYEYMQVAPLLKQAVALIEHGAHKTKLLKKFFVGLPNFLKLIL